MVWFDPVRAGLVRRPPRHHPSRMRPLPVMTPQLAATAHLPVAHRTIGQGHRMRQNRPQDPAGRHLAERHPAIRSVAVICAMIDSAISAGPFAPIANPTGAWIRAIAASETLAARSRSSRLAWVRLDPRQPR